MWGGKVSYATVANPPLSLYSTSLSRRSTASGTLPDLLTFMQLRWSVGVQLVLDDYL